MIISTDAAKSFDKIEHLFMMKTPNKLGTEGNALNTQRPQINDPTADVTPHGERLTVFPQRRCSYSPLLFSTVSTEVPARAIRQDKDERHQVRKEEIK